MYITNSLVEWLSIVLSIVSIIITALIFGKTKQMAKEDGEETKKYREQTLKNSRRLIRETTKINRAINPDKNKNKSDLLPPSAYMSLINDEFDSQLQSEHRPTVENNEK